MDGGPMSLPNGDLLLILIVLTMLVVLVWIVLLILMWLGRF
jgi:hypothetical protein